MPDLMPGYVVTPPSALPYPETTEEFLNAIMNNTGGYSGGGSSGGGTGPGNVQVMGFVIPRFNKIVYDYWDAGFTNIAHQYYQLNGSTVATLTFAYIGNAVTTANLPIQAIAQS